jgi:hypothetical protein
MSSKKSGGKNPSTQENSAVNPAFQEDLQQGKKLDEVYLNIPGKDYADLHKNTKLPPGRDVTSTSSETQMMPNDSLMPKPET